ncbi:TIGR04438 family Trp-rich protein [Hydrogenophaga soli]|nr:TIGR04438 family Trp-rich protein [Burkholderiaceae bacterium]
MWFLGLGLILLVMKWQSMGPVAAWDWWWVLSPFALAVAWWAWADATGYTKRKAVERENQRKAARIERQREKLGMLPRRKK